MASLAHILSKRSPVLCVMERTRSVDAAIDVLAKRQLGALLVVDEEDRLVGVFTERDLLRRVVAQRLSLTRTSLAEVMTPDPVVAAPTDDRETAIRKMREAGCRHLPVVVDGVVIDMLSMRDLLAVALEERLGEVDQLRAYISGAY